MWKVFLCVALLGWTSSAEALSDKRLCADPQCQKIISHGKAKTTYHPGEPGEIGFNINSNIRIKSKSAGSDPSLWGIEVHGRQGYAPKEYIQETKVLIKKKELIYEVAVERPDAGVPPSAQQAAAATQDTGTLPPSAQIPDAVPSPTPQQAAGTPPPTMPEGFIQEAAGASDAPTTTPYAIPAELKSSESVSLDSKPDIEVAAAATTTTPLDSVVATDNISLVTSTKTSDQPLDLKSTAPHVDSKVEIIEGTEIPFMHDIPIMNSAGNVLNENGGGGRIDDDLEEEDEDDYDEDDEEDEDDDDDDDVSQRFQVNVVPAVVEQQAAAFEQTELLASVAPSPATVAQAKEPDVPTTPAVLAGTPTAAENATPMDGLSALSAAELTSNETRNLEINETATADGEALTNGTQNEPLVIGSNDAREHSIFDDATHSTSTQSAEAEAVKVESIVADTFLPPAAITNPPEAPIDSAAKIEDEERRPPVTEYQAPVGSQASSETVVQSAELGDAPTRPTMSEQQPLADALEWPSVPAQDTNAEHVGQPHVAEKRWEAPTAADMDQVAAENITGEQPTTLSSSAEVPEVANSSAPVNIEPQTAETTTATPQLAVPTTPSGVTEFGFNANVHADVPIDETTPTPQFQAHNENVYIHPPPEDHQHNTQQPPIGQYDPYSRVDRQQPYAPPSPSALPMEFGYAPTTAPEATPSAPDAPTLTENSSPVPLASSDYVNAPTTPEAAPTTPEAAPSMPEAAPSMPEAAPSMPEAAPTMPEAVPTTYEAVTPDAPLQPATAEESIYATTTTLPQADSEPLKEKGLFSTIMGTVKGFVSNAKREPRHDDAADDELQRVLYGDQLAATPVPPANQMDADSNYCEKLSAHHCPTLGGAGSTSASTDCQCGSNFDLDTLGNYAELFLARMLEMTDLLACLGIVGATALLFLFGYYCFCNSSREGTLLARLNMLERSLLAVHKENAILKHELVATRNKLSCIEDNSFGSNDMVVALRTELDEEVGTKARLQQQIAHLEKELENATEAGLELNKIVSELLNNQTGDESIISSVEELQQQLNEQQNTILQINANLAEKSRENSELQLMIAEQNARLGGEIASLQQDNDELDAEKSNLQTRIDEMKADFELDITKALEGKNYEIRRLQAEMVERKAKHDEEHTKWQTGQAKIEALEECLKAVKKNPNVNVTQLLDVTNVRAELLDMQRKRASLKELLDTETDARRLAEDKLHAALVEVEKLKQDFHETEKNKLEAVTRLEVLSNYFKDKETQLQKELSLKEAMWLKQQGEAVSTVDRLTSQQDEIQSLKSQNDSLRAEIEAQLAAHKAHTGTLENRAHETWLALRQAERRHEEARTEATALRRKLTAIAGGVGNAAGGGDPSRGGLNDGNALAIGDLNSAPSPILHMESPGSPLLGRLPPPPPFLPPPGFMGPPPPHFMGMPPPPPPFVAAGEMRPPPLGRMMSPPPPGGALHHSRMRSGGRYSPQRYTDYDDDEDDDDDDDDDDDEEYDEELARAERRRRDSNGSWRRRPSYSPPPRAYRSQSPADSRYNYTGGSGGGGAERDLMSTYDTETDFSPPPSPAARGGSRGVYGGNSKPYSPPPAAASSPISESNGKQQKKKRHPAGSSDSEKSRYSGQR